jgi:hypothetical protein
MTRISKSVEVDVDVDVEISNEDIIDSVCSMSTKECKELANALARRNTPVLNPESKYLMESINAQDWMRLFSRISESDFKNLCLKYGI